MQKFLTLLLIAFSLAALTGASSSRLPWASVRAKKAEYAPGEVLVKLRPSTSNLASRLSLTARVGALQAKEIADWGLTRLILSPGQNVESTVASLANDPEVESAQPNYIYHISAVPNDTYYGDQWNLKNSAQTIASAPYSTNNPGTSGKDIGAESAWNVSTDCSAAPVAVIDTGVNYTQEDLAANMWDGGTTYPAHGYDFVDSDNFPHDLNGHGTHVAGTIGAVGNNGVGVAGVCWTAKIMALRALDASGSGTTANLVLAVNFAVARGAKVINMSIQGSAYDSAFNTAINNASNAGVVLVVAAGNDGTSNESTPVYPCNYTANNLICVAALDQSYALASFSNYGSTSVDVGAPGTNIRSTWNGTETTTSENFSSGWTYNNATWAHQTRTLSGSSYEMLTNPATWDGTSASYANSADGRVYKTFNLAGADSASLSYYAFINTESSADYFRVGYAANGADPFAGGGTNLDSLSGSTGTSAQNYTYDLANCRTASCNIGFQFTSNASVVSRGVGILLFTLTQTVLNTSSYKIISGTSMASPAVAGIAALIYSYNPSYTAAQVVASIKNGGVAASALAGKTSTGKAASAMGSISYIATPSGVSITLL